MTMTTSEEEFVKRFLILTKDWYDIALPDGKCGDGMYQEREPRAQFFNSRCKLRNYQKFCQNGYFWYWKKFGFGKPKMDDIEMALTYLISGKVLSPKQKPTEEISTLKTNRSRRKKIKTFISNTNLFWTYPRYCDNPNHIWENDVLEYLRTQLKEVSNPKADFKRIIFPKTVQAELINDDTVDDEELEEEKNKEEVNEDSK